MCVCPQAMWRVMHTYHQIKLTHERQDKRKEGSGGEGEEADARFSRNYVRTKLENGLLRVWRVSTSLHIFNCRSFECVRTCVLKLKHVFVIRTLLPTVIRDTLQSGHFILSRYTYVLKSEHVFVIRTLHYVKVYVRTYFAL